MLGQNTSEPALFQMVDLESLLPEGHRLRKIDAALDLSFVRKAVAECYVPSRGRPSIDPELAVRMMILGVLYDLSDRQLCDEIRMHAGFRWQSRLNFHDPVPDHSTISRLRNERWARSDLFTRLFEEVLRRCVEAGMVSGRHASADGTQIQANASMQSLKRRREDEDDEPPASVEALVEAPTPTEDSARTAKEPQPKGAWKGHGERYSNETHCSRTDPDARLYRKGSGQGAKLSYLVHDVIDTKSRVILGRRASLATGTAEREVALELLDAHEARQDWLGLKQAIEIFSGDTGYGTGDFVAELIDREITPHVPLLASAEIEEIPSWQRRTFNLARHRKRCEKVRQAMARNAVRLEQRTHGYTVSRKLRTRSEHTFAEGKNEHGLGQARHRGLERVDRQSLLVATVQNLKRLARTLWRRAQSGAADLGYLNALLHLVAFVTVAEGARSRRRYFRRFFVSLGACLGLRLNRLVQKPLCSTAF